MGAVASRLHHAKDSAGPSYNFVARCTRGSPPPRILDPHTLLFVSNLNDPRRICGASFSNRPAPIHTVERRATHSRSCRIHGILKSLRVAPEFSGILSPASKKREHFVGGGFVRQKFRRLLYLCPPSASCGSVMAAVEYIAGLNCSKCVTSVQAPDTSCRSYGERHDEEIGRPSLLLLVPRL